MTKSEIIKDKKYYIFLEELRKSAITNMYGATHYLQEAYGLTREDANFYVVNYLNDAEQIQTILYRDLTKSRSQKGNIIAKVLENEDVLCELYGVCDNAPINFTVGNVIDIYDDFYDREIDEDFARSLLRLFIEGYDYLEYCREKEIKEYIDEPFDGTSEDLVL